LSEYPTFDWPSIGATVLNRDDDGVTAVEWNGHVFTRRSPNNKFDVAVWFSRHLGQDSDGCDLKHRMAVTATGWLSRSSDDPKYHPLIVLFSAKPQCLHQPVE
jgi:hypothetical protein